MDHRRFGNSGFLGLWRWWLQFSAQLFIVGSESMYISLIELAQEAMSLFGTPFLKIQAG